MKKFTLFKKAFLSFLCTGIASAFSVIALAQPTVTVPIGCEVVDVGMGTGTSLGFGGTVGNGGIVTMPDPFPTLAFPNSTFTINPNGTSANDWSLQGDLSIYPNAFGSSAIQTASGSTADIMSYNKDVRISESATQGRSIGRINIPYDDTVSLCSGGISFLVYKVYSDSLPPIIGPDCWLPDSTYTYSVDQIASDNLPDAIGLDVYYWTAVDNNGDTIYNSQDPLSYPSFEGYTSADKSSITVTAPSSLDSPYTLTCCFGRANPWDGDDPLTTHTSCVTKMIGASPTAPLIVVDTCVSVSATSFNIGVSTFDPTYTYNWSSNNPQWLITPTSGGAAVVTGIGYNGGTISLEVTNGGCSSVIVQETINRAFDASISITGDTCVSSNSVHNYAISGVAQGNLTCWELPMGWTSNPLNGTNSNLDITIPNGTPGGSYALKAYSCACPDDTIYLTVRVRPEDPTIVSGSTCINYGSTGTLTYTVSPAGNYDWTIPSGWTGSSSTESITVTPNGTNAGQITATGIDTSGMGCTSLNPAVWNVDFNPIDPDTAAVGCINVGIDGNTSVIVNNAPTPTFVGTYIVSSTPSDLLTGYSVNPSTGEITLFTSGTASATNYTLHIQHQTSCGTSTTLNIPVTYGSGSTLLMVPLPSSDLYYINPAVPGAASYAWYLDGVLNGNTGPTLSLFGTSTPPDSVCVEVTRTDGCITKLCTPGGTYSALILGNENAGSLENNNIRIFPNPTEGDFSISVEKVEKQADVTIIDMKGAVISENQPLTQGTNRITNKQLVKGSYVLIITVDGKTHAQKIEVIH
ncbi:MAG: T9SS type A sorting domain-containing protein [Crocinitomicaceae bacterium]|nr:T9SS type A sorting domain-containing protein [Crocinitomicaceae bacterium]